MQPKAIFPLKDELSSPSQEHLLLELPPDSLDATATSTPSSRLLIITGGGNSKGGEGEEDGNNSNSTSCSFSPKSFNFDDSTESPSEHHEPVAGFSSCSINLLKTILGSGMLTMPAAFAAIGYVPGLFLVIIAASFAAFGLHLFVASSQYAERNATVNRLASLTYPQLTILFDFAIALKCFGVAASYLIVIGDMMPSIAIGIGFRQAYLLNRRFWILSSAVIMIPLAFLRRIDSLKYTSFAGIVSIFYLVLVAIWNFLKEDAIRPPLNAGMEAFAPFSPASFSNFSVFVFSFTCHQNIFPILREAKDNSTIFMNRVILFCVYLSAIIYILFSIISYANFGQVVQRNIFLNYPSDAIEMILARTLFAFLSAFSYPLQTLPCRISMEHLLPIEKVTKRAHSESIHIWLTILIIIGTFLVALTFDSLMFVSSVIGTVAGIPICYILPFLFYYKLTEGAGWTTKRLAAACLAAFGIIAMLVSGFSIFISLLYPI